MRWRTAILVGLAPLTGCTTLGRTAFHNVAYESHLQHGDAKIVKQLREDARLALREVSCQHPRKTFTDEFRDGFIDGYVDYLNNGGPALPPAVAPTRYRKSSYFTVEGHALVRDYFLGFKYGCDVAVATGRRPIYTTPVVISEEVPVVPLHSVVMPSPPPGLSTDPEVMPPVTQEKSEKASKSSASLIRPTAGESLPRPQTLVAPQRQVP